MRERGASGSFSVSLKHRACDCASALPLLGRLKPWEQSSDGCTTTTKHPECCRWLCPGTSPPPPSRQHRALVGMQVGLLRPRPLPLFPPHSDVSLQQPPIGRGPPQRLHAQGRVTATVLFRYTRYQVRKGTCHTDGGYLCFADP